MRFTIAGALFAVVAFGQPLPVAQQNALVQKYCAVCHSDAHKNGGLSLERFDAGRRDPTLAAMMASKLKNGAMGAAGIPGPGQAVEDALLAALSAAADGARNWNVDRAQTPPLIVSMVREVPSQANPGQPELYRLKLTCSANREAEMQLSWSPRPAPSSGQVLSASVDGRAAEKHAVEGSEKMGNGSNGTTGPASWMLPATQLPEQSLTISGLFPGETVEFPFRELTVETRRELSSCFAGR